VSSSTSSTDGLLACGRVGRPHGLDGSFHVTRPRARLLVLGARVLVAGAWREVVRRSGTEDRPVLRLEGVAGREAVEALRGEDLWLARTDAPELEEDEWYVEDLVGLRVVDGDVVVGEVAEVLPLPANEVLVCPRPGRPDLLVPLIRDAVRAVDVEGGVVDVDLAFLGEEA
jgi:16S rRNA processing protein RimM